MKYFENRQNSLTGISEDEIETAFKAIIENFNLKWLKTRGSNPLQQLWNRKDYLSTNELFCFGTHLNNLINIDKKWVEKQIKLIKSDHRNNQQGAFFEICALGMFINESQKVSPAKGSNPGYDGELHIEPENIMRISIKNYGLSVHYQDFYRNANDFNKYLKELLSELKILKVQLLIDAFHHIPNKDDWDLLKSGLRGLLTRFKGEIIYAGIPERWGIIIFDIIDNTIDFHPNYNSYSLILSAVYHKNEEKNLLDKLDEANHNIIKHSEETSTMINTVFIHLSENASILKCKEWIESYFQQFPDKKITGVILYQPVVSTELQTNHPFIHHCFQLVFRDDKFSNWNILSKNIKISPLIGRVSMEPSENKLMYEYEGKQHTHDLNERYLYQRGDYYAKQKEENDGTKTGNVDTIGSGIFVHSVMQLFEDQPTFIISEQSPPEYKLGIL